MTGLEKKLARMYFGKLAYDEQADTRTSALMGPIEDQDQKMALKALETLVDKANLPINVDDINNRDYSVKVPKGFESLFKSIVIRVRWTSDNTATVNWHYEHPEGGTNGLSVGFIGMKDDEWGWQISNPRREWGMVK